MNIKNGLIILILYLLCSCTSTNVSTDVRTTLADFIGTKIATDSIVLIPINKIDSVCISSYLASKYKLYVYIDSINCTACKINKMREWSTLFKLFNAQQASVIVIFNSDNVQGISSTMELYELDFTYFLDIEHEFKKVNKIPNIEILQTFLTRNDTVIAAGTPLNNDKIINLYQTLISSN
ncbi:MAG: hypothetical protein RR555_03755 [Bacteroidales bacterium]